MTASWTMRSHECDQGSGSTGPSIDVELHDETEMSEMRRLMRYVRGNTRDLILNEARSCYQFSKWADVSLVSSSDGVAIKVHSLVLGAACPMLQSALEDMAQVDQDEMTVIIPDTNREDLTIFANSLYNIDKTNTNYSSLMHLINFESHSSVDLKTQKDDSSDQDY